MTHNTETSVIIRTFNEEKYLPGLLRALKQQNYKNFETIIVDSGSIDTTRDIARTFNISLLKIAKRDFTFGYSLNYGIKNSKGTYLVLVSAHTKPTDDNWMGNLIEPLRDEQTAMAYGRQLGVEQSKYGEIEDFRRLFAGGGEVSIKPSNFFTFL